MARIFLQAMVENLPEGSLPANWRDFDLGTFSRGKQLWAYQQTALRNALAALWKFYEDGEAATPEAMAGLKERYLRWYLDFGLEAELDIPLDHTTAAKRKTAALLERYYESDAEGERLPYVQFINRMSFWMATGSGKTLVIVKMIELLRELMRRVEIPALDILVLAHRDDLLEQLRQHVDEFNAGGGLFIRLRELREYAEAKREAPSLFRGQELTVFTYRSDNLSDEQKEKIVDFRSYDNEGRWYILLDEAHKGDKEDSKRQHIYSILSRNGFLFNFSATFTDARDIITTAANFNLSEFIRKGHGKHICILRQETRVFKRGDEYTEAEKQKIVLKALLMLTYARRQEGWVRAVRGDLYHRPLLMALVNSVNTEDADLKLFFRELARIGKGEVATEMWMEARGELLAELRERPPYLFEQDVRVEVDEGAFARLGEADVLREAFNAGGVGEMEVLVRPSNRQEVAFKLKTSDVPFALVRIGDIAEWLKEELAGYEINRQVTDEGYFERLNHPDSEINILLGSRSFYEGWDSNRPNVIMYVNIGTGTEARKFILQSVGRGVRIEPLKNQRKRLRELYTSGALEGMEALFQAVKEEILPLESVFIFGTNREALNVVIGELDQEGKQAGEHEIALEVNEEAVQGKLLLVPVYRQSETPLHLKQRLAKFQLAAENLETLRRYLEYVDDDRVFLALHDRYEPRQAAALRASLAEADRTFRTDGRAYKNLEVLTRQALQYFAVYGRELSGFKELEEEINHFRHIKVRLEALGDLEQRIRRVLGAVRAVREAKARYEAGQMTLDELLEAVGGDKNETFFASGSLLEIRQIANHYYIPVLLSRDERIDYIRSVIRVESERRFLSELEAYVSEPNNRLKACDWWLFSRVDEYLDNIGIPYYYPIENRMALFKPDFIFWMQRGSRYDIVFVDPKGTGRTEYEHKVDGYRALFEAEDEPKIFEYEGLEVRVRAFLHTADRQYLAEGYRRYWVDRMEQVVEGVLGARE